VQVFTNWANVHLRERSLKIVDMAQNLDDGILLIHLLEIVSGKSMTRPYGKAPKLRIQRLENAQIALQFMKNESIKLVAVVPEGTAGSFSRRHQQHQ
jgi:hypothetical protein